MGTGKGGKGGRKRRRHGGGRGVKMLILWDGNGTCDHGAQR